MAWGGDRINEPDVRLPHLVNLLWEDAMFSASFIAGFVAFLSRDVNAISGDDYGWLSVLISRGERAAPKLVRYPLISFCMRCVAVCENLRHQKKCLDFLGEACRVLGRSKSQDTDELYRRIDSARGGATLFYMK
jgi:hypothetical protein